MKMCTDVSANFKKLKNGEPRYLYMKGHAGSFIGETVIDGKVYNVIECTGSWERKVLYSYVDEDGKPVEVARKVGMDVIFDNMGSAFSGMTELMQMSSSMGGMGMNVFSEMLDNQKLLDEQYDVIAGEWPDEYNEVVLVVTPDRQISKMTLYMLGMRDPSKIEGEVADLMAGKYESEKIDPFTFEEILGTRFMLLTTEDFYD